VVTDDATGPWAALLHDALALDGSGWAGWCDGHAAHRIAGVIEDAAGRAAVA
jgi:hypothetical protein